MAEVVFQGPAALTLDGKGRVTMPARHRDLLQALCGGQLTITKHYEGCLWLFPRSAWEGFREKIMSWPIAAAGWRRMYLGSAVDVEVDGSSRVLVPPELRAAVGLERDVMLLGMGDRFELWDAQALAEHEQAVKQQPLPSGLGDLNF